MSDQPSRPDPLPPDPPAAGRPAPIVVDYQTVRPLGSRRAAMVRLFMLIAAILAINAAAFLIFFHPIYFNSAGDYGMGAGPMGTPFAPVNFQTSESHERWLYFGQGLAYLALFLLTQRLFLSQRGNWRLGLSNQGPPPWPAAIAAGFIGMLLAGGLVATLLEFPNWWLKLTGDAGAASSPQQQQQQHFGIVWIVMLSLWTFWTIVFVGYWRSLDRYTALRRTFRWLIAGTVLELFVAMPAHAYILRLRGSDCYFTRGTYTGIVFGATAALWLFGPGVFLLFLREKIRSESLPIGEKTPEAPDEKVTE